MSQPDLTYHHFLLPVLHWDPKIETQILPIPVLFLQPNNHPNLLVRLTKKGLRMLVKYISYLDLTTLPYRSQTRQQSITSTSKISSSRKTNKLCLRICKGLLNKSLSLFYRKHRAWAAWTIGLQQSGSSS